MCLSNISYNYKNVVFHLNMYNYEYNHTPQLQKSISNMCLYTEHRMRNIHQWADWNYT